MPAKKTAKPKTVAGVTIASKPRKHGAPSNAFKKGNTSGFQPGVSGNPGGKVKCDRDRLIGKSVIRYLQDSASDEVCLAHGLPPHSSYGQILAKRLIRLALNGEQWAYSEILALTEVKRARLDVFGFGDADGSLQETPPLIQLVWVESDGDGHPKYNTIDGMPPALPAAT